MKLETEGCALARELRRMGMELFVVVDRLICPECGGEDFLFNPGRRIQEVECLDCGCGLTVCFLPNGRTWILEVK
jgi:hypothetical protein